jgi:tetratricopeptide (TPR) repeat protein
MNMLPWNHPITARLFPGRYRLNLAVTRADDALKAGRFRQAADMYEGVLRTRPKSAELHYRLGSARARLGQMDAALEHFKKAFQFNNKYTDAPAGIAMLHAQLGERDMMREKYADSKKHFLEAVKWIQKARAIKDSAGYARIHARAATGLGAWYVLRGRDTAAAEKQLALAADLLKKAAPEQPAREHRTLALAYKELALLLEEQNAPAKRTGNARGQSLSHIRRAVHFAERIAAGEPGEAAQRTLEQYKITQRDLEKIFSGGDSGPIRGGGLPGKERKK